MKTFGETLAQTMKIRGVKQNELSERSGVYQSYISRLLNGKLLDPTFTKAIALIRALGMTMDEFVAVQEEEKE